MADNATTNPQEEKLPFVQKKKLEGDYKVSFVGKCKKHEGEHGKFISCSLLIENKEGKKAWFSATGDDAYKVMGITSARHEDGSYVTITGLKAIKSGTYTNIYFTIGKYVKKESTTEEISMDGFVEITSNEEVPF